ncbi:MAG: endo-alpha-N-acetylgalactosaminidase family protein [Holophagales bacterium]|jgi:endo-alpha-N-acetylgalactosaminidase|nr:endo-alpha-N-acetylgalactosaminidase family protein [Holophagales bacterium]
MFKLFPLITIAVMLSASQTAYGQSLARGNFSVTLRDDFPGLVSYSLANNRVVLPKDEQSLIIINDKPEKPEVRFQATDGNSANYKLGFRNSGISFTVTFRIARNFLAITIDDIKETGSVMLRTVEIPGLALLAGSGDADIALGNFMAASYASEKPEDHDIFSNVRELEFKDNLANKAKNRNERGERGASYAFVSDGKIAAGLFTNVLDENLRMIVRTKGEGKNRVAWVTPGKWTWREIPHAKTVPPKAILVVANDINGDGAVTWQDAAIAYRESVPKPYGAEKTKSYPIAHIAMNFGSQATNPFLRVLDNAKKIWLYTDGLGQRIQQKGYQSEGHDSSHPDYGGNVGRRQGGRDELNYAIRRGHDFNVLTGVHINAHEYHLESRNFDPKIVNMGTQGWAWLDESYLTDYRYDAAYGTLDARLEALRKDLPDLDFVYLDVYYGYGWPAWHMWNKINSLGLIQFTEFPGTMEAGAVWIHVANDWTQQIGGKGDRSQIARFVHYSDKDTFQHEPLLRGSNCDGFLGWHAERDMLQVIQSTFTVNLPTKFLQHFQLLRLEKGSAWFTDGVRTEFDGQTARIYGTNGKLINSCRYEKPNTRPIDNLCFIPWVPEKKKKIYHWNDNGGDSTWEVPLTWANVKTAFLYRLTDLGRVFEREIPVVGGKATLNAIEQKTPYVLYRDAPSPLPEINWGEGGLVKDPGFDSHSFYAWKPSQENKNIRFENTDFGQTELVMDGRAASSVSQEIIGLTPGQTYAASVWFSISGKRPATLKVESAYDITPFRDRQPWMVRNAPRSARGEGTSNMFDGNPNTCYRSLKPEEANRPVGHNVAAQSSARTQEPTIELGLDGKNPVSSFTIMAPSGQGDGTIKTFYAEITSGKQKEFVNGTLKYDARGIATVNFARSLKAETFKLIATSVVNDTGTVAIAGLDLLGSEKELSKMTPMTPVSYTVDATEFINYTDQSSKYLRNWHRMKVIFSAPENGCAKLSLQIEADEKGTEVRFDDVRLVKTSISTPPSTAKSAVLFEDFENVDEGWGPFMYGWKGPMNTHLSEANPPYTKDVIGGNFSLKSRLEDSPDMLYRTVPATLKLKPNTTYKIGFDVLNDQENLFAFAAGVDTGAGQEVIKTQMIEKTLENTHKYFSTVFKTDDRAGWFIGITKILSDQPMTSNTTSNRRRRSNRAGTIVIDNLLVEEITGAGK